MPCALTGNVYVVGTGKMARDIGLFFWSKGYAVTWLSRDAERRDDLERYISKKTKRLAAMLEEQAGQGACRFALLGDANLPTADIVLECGVEHVETKRAAVKALAPCCRDDTLVLSNSSSILPGDLGDLVVGMHFFHPVALSEFVELVFPTACPKRLRARTEGLARDLGLVTMAQEPDEAFTLNRLLLPLMAEVFRQFHLGHDLDILDSASRSPLLPTGQVAVMDDIGLDVLAPAVAKYTNRMPPNIAPDYRHFKESLWALVRFGYLGKKNRRALLGTEPNVLRSKMADVPLRSKAPLDAPVLSGHLLHLFINSCFTFIDASRQTEAPLSLALQAVFGAETTIRQALTEAGAASVRDGLEALYRETGISYFRPSRLLN